MGRRKLDTTQVSFLIVRFWGLALAALCYDPGLDVLAGVLRSSSARSRSIKKTERCERWTMLMETTPVPWGVLTISPP